MKVGCLPSPLLYNEIRDIWPKGPKLGVGSRGRKTPYVRIYDDTVGDRGPEHL